MDIECAALQNRQVSECSPATLDPTRIHASPPGQANYSLPLVVPSQLQTLLSAAECAAHRNPLSERVRTLTRGKQGRAGRAPTYALLCVVAPPHPKTYNWHTARQRVASRFEMVPYTILRITIGLPRYVSVPNRPRPAMYASYVCQAWPACPVAHRSTTTIQQRVTLCVGHTMQCHSCPLTPEPFANMHNLDPKTWTAAGYHKIPAPSPLQYFTQFAQDMHMHSAQTCTRVPLAVSRAPNTRMIRGCTAHSGS